MDAVSRSNSQINSHIWLLFSAIVSKFASIMDAVFGMPTVSWTQASWLGTQIEHVKY